jgi:hypothetical protein
MQIEHYSILKNGRCFAEFTSGDMSRFDGAVFTREVAMMEFDSCVDFWKTKGVICNWSLKITIIPHKGA